MRGRDSQVGGIGEEGSEEHVCVDNTVALTIVSLKYSVPV
jgi:hypothetical protein